MASLYYESQLCHHGVLGQRWGIRRFQRKDGSLTKAGERRRERILRKAFKKEQAKRVQIDIENQKVKQKLATQRAQQRVLENKKKLDDLKNKEKEAANTKKDTVKVSNEKPVPKSLDISEMSDADLNAMIRRLELERKYYDYTHPAPPKKDPTIVRRLISELGNSVVKASGEVTTQLIKNAMLKTINNAMHKTINNAISDEDEKKKK